MPKRILQGKIVSDKMDKTVVVVVERRTMHPLYKKYVKKSARYSAHDEGNLFRTGDTVEIQECRPLSKNKTWTVISNPPAGRTSNKAPVDAETAEGLVKTTRKASKKKDKETNKATGTDTKKPAAKKK
ncbi:MAG: 30S ribosomal protein S17 [Alphaproteobacteria bacterium]|nr:30S ribosomal protein S17 [Alphaproteobacteria bacterium]